MSDFKNKDVNKNKPARRHENRDDLAGEHKWGDLGQLVLLFIFIIAVVIDKLFLKMLDSLFEEVTLWFQLVGGIIFVTLGGLLAKKGLKIVFNEKRTKPQVIDIGVFKIVRHPIYLGSILTYVGFLFFTFSFLGFLVWLVIIFFYFYISYYEEKLLLKKFGEEYRNYQKRVPMIIPIKF